MVCKGTKVKAVWNLSTCVQTVLLWSEETPVKVVNQEVCQSSACHNLLQD